MPLFTMPLLAITLMPPYAMLPASAITAPLPITAGMRVYALMAERDA